MKIKVFGKTLFETQSKSDMLYAISSDKVKESKFLPDFMVSHNSDPFSNWGVLTQTPSGAVIGEMPKKLDKAVEEKKVDKKTPKDVFTLKLLHDESFKINTDPAYVDKQISDFKDKLALIKSEEYDMNRGVTEIGSIVLRLENRKKYAEVRESFEEFPYTTQSRIDDVIKENDYLKIGQVAQFLADMPAEAVEAMKRYNKACDKLCGKQAVFYIIADKKDFEKTVKRRDPILLAQSPFGHFWQILGAWDKEMMLLEDL